MLAPFFAFRQWVGELDNCLTRVVGAPVLETVKALPSTFFCRSGLDSILYLFSFLCFIPFSFHNNCLFTAALLKLTSKLKFFVVQENRIIHLLPFLSLSGLIISHLGQTSKLILILQTWESWKERKKSSFQFFLLANSIPENISKNLRIFALQRKGKNDKNLKRKNENGKKLIRAMLSDTNCSYFEEYLI